MDQISDISIERLSNGRFIKPYLMSYKQNGISKLWELVTVHASVSVLIFNKDSKKIVVVQQFRPAVYFCNYSEEEKKAGLSPPKCVQSQTSVESSGGPSDGPPTGTGPQSDAVATDKNFKKQLKTLPGKLGITLELCAGIVDKSCDLIEIAKSEVLEECGYDVPLSCLQKITTFRSGVGTGGERQTMFYAEVTDAMKVGPGGGLASEGEMIEVVDLSLEEAKQMLGLEEVNAPGPLLFAFMWFFTNKASSYAS